MILMNDYSGITEALQDNFQLLLDDLGLDMDYTGGRFTSRCHIHDGDSQNALTVYPDRDKWFCWSHNCHKTTYNSLISFARMVLSSRYCGWSKKGDKLYSFRRHDPIPTRRLWN